MVFLGSRMVLCLRPLARKKSTDSSRSHRSLGTRLLENDSVMRLSRRRVLPFPFPLALAPSSPLLLPLLADLRKYLKVPRSSIHLPSPLFSYRLLPLAVPLLSFSLPLPPSQTQQPSHLPLELPHLPLQPLPLLSTPIRYRKQQEQLELVRQLEQIGRVALEGRGEEREGDGGGEGGGSLNERPTRRRISQCARKGQAQTLEKRGSGGGGGTERGDTERKSEASRKRVLTPKTSTNLLKPFASPSTSASTRSFHSFSARFR